MDVAAAADPVRRAEAALTAAATPPLEHAFITLTARRARDEARASARRHAAGAARGPLDGMPIAIKDLFDVAGTPTTAGSALRRDVAPAAADAPAIAHLAAAGMVCVGKTNLSELAYSGLGLNPHFGTPRNPYDNTTARVPGGSSSGSAVAVAARAVECAIGTDTSGSVRIPAALCGVVGFRPTAARIDRRGVFPLAPTLDTVGPLTTSVSLAAALDQALRGLPVAPVPPLPITALELVAPSGELLDDAAPDVAAAFDPALAALQAAGARVDRRPVAALEQAQRLMDDHGTVVVAEAGRLHADLVRRPEAEALLDRRVLTRLRQATTMSGADYDLLLAQRPGLQRMLATELGSALAVFPTVRHTAPAIAPLERDDALFLEVNRRTLRSTMLGSYLDMPGISLPIGPGDGGLPVGLLLSAPCGQDDRVLAAAAAVEAALGGPATSRPDARPS